MIFYAYFVSWANSEISLQQTSFIVGTSLQPPLFSGTDEMTLKLITKPLCSGHFITDTSLSQLTLPPRTELLIMNMFNTRHVLQEICIHFTLENVLQFRLRFLWSLSLYFSASLMAFSAPWKCRDCKFVVVSSPYLSLWLTCFPVAKMSKRQWDRDRNMDTTMVICCTWTTTSSLWQELLRTRETASCPLRWLALSRVTNTQWLPNYHISMISSNILFLSFPFSQHQPFDTLWIQLHYTKTPERKFLK